MRGQRNQENESTDRSGLSSAIERVWKSKNKKQKGGKEPGKGRTSRVVVVGVLGGGGFVCSCSLLCFGWGGGGVGFGGGVLWDCVGGFGVFVRVVPGMARRPLLALILHYSYGVPHPEAFTANSLVRHTPTLSLNSLHTRVELSTRGSGVSRDLSMKARRTEDVQTYPTGEGNDCP